MTRNRREAHCEALHFEDASYAAVAPLLTEVFTAVDQPLVTRVDILRHVERRYPELFRSLVGGMVPGVQDFRPNDISRYDRAATLLGVEWAAWGNHHRHGQKTFVFAAPLTRLLAHTDVRVPRGSVKLPFPAVYYRWLNSGVTIANDDGTRHEVEGAYLFTERGVDGVLVLTMYVTSRDPHVRVTNALYFSVRWDDPDAVLVTDDFRTLGVPEEYVPIANLAINSTLYLSSPEAETRQILSPHRALDEKKTRHPKKLRRLARERAKTIGVDYTFVGESTVLPTDAHGALLTVHHWVRGHWKMQAYGEHRASRRPLWIKPYERGKDLAEQIQRRYTVD